MIQSENKNVFLYRFSFNGKFNFYKRFTNYKGPGVSHGDELGYIFSAPYPIPPLQQRLKLFPRENFMIHRMVKMWTNFAKSGDPNLGEPYESQIPFYWPPIKSSHEIYYLDINDRFRIMTGIPYHDRMRFWEEIYRKYG